MADFCKQLAKGTTLGAALTQTTAAPRLLPVSQNANPTEIPLHYTNLDDETHFTSCNWITLSVQVLSFAKSGRQANGVTFLEKICIKTTA